MVPGNIPIELLEGMPLEILKKILKIAIQHQAVKAQVGLSSVVELQIGSAKKSVDLGASVTEADLGLIHQTLIPQGLVKGSINIPQVGTVLVRAQESPSEILEFYLPPYGAKLLEDEEKARVTPPPLAPEALEGAPQGGFIPPALLGGGEVPALKLSPQAIKVPEAPPLVRVAPQPDFPSFPEPPSFPTPASPMVKSASLTFGPDDDSGGVSDGLNPIDQVLKDLIGRRGSDLHMTIGEPICFRIDGEMTRVGESPITPSDMEHYLLPIIPDRNRQDFAESNDTDFAYEVRAVGRFRVNMFRDRNGVGTVMRHIPQTILSAEQLNLPPAITKFCQLTKGLVLVTGPTGSGKSTTLAAMVDLINRNRAEHILTIEDPIEFVHQQKKCLVNQREVHRHTGSFARALKAALREDPDVILIGELRDLETVAIAIETAETGHLVFGTLHTNTAVSTVDRIIDQFPTDQQEQIRTMLASSLKGVVAQTLLKKKGGGRVAAHEILVLDSAVSAMIREGKNHMIASHMQTQKGEGNILLNESLLKFVKDGVVDADDAFKKAVDKSGFADACKRAGIKLQSVSGEPQKASSAKAS